MGKPTGFKEYPRGKQPYRKPTERIKDFRQILLPWNEENLKIQAARCMDCGIPFCHRGCPLGNLIPDWNDLVYKNRWKEAIDRLHATNNFPEFTGTLCPAPCEPACVLSINDDPVTIKAIEQTIIDHAFEKGWVVPEVPQVRTGKKVAIVGSGPAGLAAAQQLNRAGHRVTVFERDDRIGGLLRYGIPEFKLEKAVLDRRLSLMEKEEICFQTGVHVGLNLSLSDLRSTFDAILLTCGATLPRDLPIPGRDLKGIHFAMDYLTKKQEGMSAKGKRVVILGGGDTGADCLGTALREGALSVKQLEILSQPPDRLQQNPWPEWPLIFRTSYALEEGGHRQFSIETTHFSGLDSVQKLHGQHLDKDRSPFELDVDMVLLALGFLGPEPQGLIDQLGVKLTERGNVWCDALWMTNVAGIFTAGDMHRGQSLIVWAIAEGRSAARGIDLYLMGQSDLPAPL